MQLAALIFFLLSQPGTCSQNGSATVVPKNSSTPAQQEVDKRKAPANKAEANEANATDVVKQKEVKATAAQADVVRQDEVKAPTDKPPAATKDTLNSTQASKNATVSQFVADPKEAKLRAKRFKSKMENHVDEMRKSLHEHEKAVDTKIHLEKIRKEREAEAAEKAKWEAEQAKVQKIAADMAREKKEKEEKKAASENKESRARISKISSEAARKFHAREMRKPQQTIDRSSANAMQIFGLVFVIAMPLFA